MFKVKDDGRYKARLVAKGFSQRKGLEYDEIFAPVVRQTSIRILLAIVAAYDLELEQLDVKITFLHGDLEETIYMKQSEGFIVDGKSDWVCKCNDPHSTHRRIVEYFFLSHTKSYGHVTLGDDYWSHFPCSCFFFRFLNDRFAPS